MKNLLLSYVMLLGLCYFTNEVVANSPSTTFSSFAKVLSPDHVWYTVSFDVWRGGVYYGRRKITDDSILIGNHYYHKILYSQDSIGNNWTQTHKYTRELDGKLWVLDSVINYEEVLVMDMNLEVGDRFGINQGDDTLYVISTKILNDFAGRLRKVVELSCQPDEAAFITWIEGIGPLRDIFEAAMGYCYVDFGFNTLTCFYTNDVQVWVRENSLSCWEEPILPVSFSDIHPWSTWYSTTWNNEPGGEECALGINTINVKPSILIKRQWSRVLGVTDNGVYNSESAVPFYRKDNKMYFYEDDEWKLLYDFNAQVGDTVTYYISSKAKYYQLHGLFFDTIYTGPYQLVIIDIDTVYPERGQPLKRFKTERINGHEQGHFMGDIIERAGSVLKLFGNYGIIIPPECINGPRLRCFEEIPL